MSEYKDLLKLIASTEPFDATRFQQDNLDVKYDYKTTRGGSFSSLERLMHDFKELGGKIIACDMTMEIMGIKKEDLREDLITEYGAVGTYIQEARESTINLFI